MLNPVHTAADLAADRRRTLRAEADAYRLARSAASDGSTARARRVRVAWLRLLRGRRVQGCGRAPA